MIDRAPLFRFAVFGCVVFELVVVLCVFGCSERKPKVEEVNQTEPTDDAPMPETEPVSLDLGPTHPPLNSPGDPSRRDAAFKEARTFAAGGQMRKAIRLLEEVIAIGPEDGKTRLLLGICRSNDRDDVEGSRRELRRAHFLPGYQAEAAFLLAELDAKMAIPDRAEAWLDEALRLDPTHEKALVRKARLRRRAGDFDAALELIERCIAANPNSGTAYHERGSVALRQGDVDAAIADFRHALDIDPTDSSAWYNLATALRRAGELDQARRAQDEFELMKSVFSESRHDIVVDPSKRGDMLRTIVTRFPNVWRAKLELARLVATMEGTDAAIASLRAAIEAHPDVGELRVELSSYLEQAGDFEGSRQARAEAESLLNAVQGS